MNRYLDTLFRHKQVFLIPFLVTPLIALMVAISSGETYKVEALIWAQPSRVLDPPEETRSTSVPNEREAQAIREWLETEAFRGQVIDQVGLTSAVQQGDWPAPSQLSSQLQRAGITHIPGLGGLLNILGLTPPRTTAEAMDRAMDMVKDSLTIATEGQNLMRVVYEGKEPALGQRMVDQVINIYRDRVLQSRTQEARLAIDFYSGQLQSQESRLQEASDGYRQFLATHPAPLPGQVRPAPEEAELENLRRAYLLEQSIYESYLRRLDEVRVESEAAISNRDLTFQVVDPPVEPEAAGFSATTISTALALGVVVGAVLGLAPIVAMTWLDGTVRYPEDIEHIASPPFIARAPLIPFKGKQGEALRSVIAGGAATSVNSSNGREMQ